MFFVVITDFQMHPLSVNFGQNIFTHFLVYFNVLTKENKSAVETATKITSKYDDQALYSIFSVTVVTKSNELKLARACI